MLIENWYITIPIPYSLDASALSQKKHLCLCCTCIVVCDFLLVFLYCFFASSFITFLFLSLCSFYKQTHIYIYIYIYRITQLIGILGHWLLRGFYTGIYLPILSFCQPRGLMSTISRFSCLPRVNYEKLSRLNL